MQREPPFSPDFLEGIYLDRTDKDRKPKFVNSARIGRGETMIQNDTEFGATQYRLAQFEKVVCGLCHELPSEAFADHV